MSGAGHTVALLLFALGAVTALVGGIGTSLDLSDVYCWLTLLAGLGLFGLGVWVYRRSDPMMAVFRRPDGSVVYGMLPLLHPYRLVLFGLVTACVVYWWSGWSDGSRAKVLGDPRAWVFAGLWILYAVLVLVELGGRIFGSSRARRETESEQPASDRGDAEPLYGPK